MTVAVREKEYTIDEMRTLLNGMSGMYDLARIVDPIECQVLTLQKDGTICMNESCYNIWNADRKCVNCSSAVACKTGCHQEKTENFKDQVYHIQSNPVKLKLPDGGRCSVVMELVSVDAEPAKERKVTVNDRESENEKETAFRYLATYDTLTGLLKSDMFYEQARKQMASDPRKSWTIVTGDVMQFKLFNNLFGAEKGNEALIKTAEILKEIADRCGGLCSRLYRDKFTLLLPSDQYRESDFTEAADALKSAFSNGMYTFCIHFGVYENKNADIPVTVMRDRADMARRTINQNVNRIVAYFDGEIMEKSLQNQEIISNFDEALKNGHLQMYLQPITGEDGIPFSAEALVRWVRPDGTVISPALFIETLEDAGLIHELDKAVWEQAVKQLSAWKNTDWKDLTISVNVSAKDFYSIDIYRILTGLTEKYGVSNDRLRLEITESALVKEPERRHPVLSRLQEAGFLIEIDDFGKGQSSLSLLKDIRADILKLDMGFLRETENRKRGQIILRTVITMANELGMQVIAEGIETEKQLRSLSSMGCDHFQGYYFSRPIPVADFENKYKKQRPSA